MALYATAIDSHLKSLDLARRVVYGTSEGVTDIPDDFILALSMDCRVNERGKNAYREILPELATWYSKFRIRTWDQAHYHQQLKNLRGHSFFSTKGGRIGFAHPGCQPGD